jgi:L-asparaginase
MKRIALIATGGTIAGRAERSDDLTGYTAGALGAEALLAAVPELAGLARIVPESPFSIDSKDITAAHWLELAHRVAAHLGDPGCDGVVITHGTDTIEETAWFLHLVLPPDKPVVLTCAMRPATALSADGPLNLLQAVGLAASAATAGIGVVVAVNGEIHSAREVRKAHTQSVAAIGSAGGALGRSDPPCLSRRPVAALAGSLPLPTLGPMPQIPLIDVPGGADPLFLHLAVERGMPGVVLALPGNGSLPAHWLHTVELAVDRGVLVVRASRTGDGRVTERPGVPGLAAGSLAPAKARIALMLALAARRPEAFEALAAA